MAINTLEFNTTMTRELDKAVVQKSATGFLADNALRAKFVGAKTVLIPDVDMSGLGDYDRDNGFVGGSITVANQPYTLTQDRGRSFQLDREDEDETGIANLAGEVLAEFVRTKVVPEMDAYVLSNLATYAATEGQTLSGSTSDPYALFTDALSRVQDAIGYDEELVAFMDNTMLSALQKSEEISRSILVSDFKKGEVNLKVRKLDGVSLLPVEKSRMKTAYSFLDGETEGEESGGFAPADGAKSIGLLIMPKRAASLIKKTEKTRTFSPNQNQNADAYKIDYRVYYDVFVKNSLGGGIFVYLYPDTHTLTVSVADESEQAIEGATVTVTDAQLHPVAANADGTFSLADGTYTVTAAATGYVSGSDTVTMDGADATKVITLEEDT